MECEHECFNNHRLEEIEKNIHDMQEKGIGLYLFSNTKGSGKTKKVCILANEIMKK